MSCKGAPTIQLDWTTRTNPCTKSGVLSNCHPPNCHHMAIWEQAIMLNQPNCNIEEEKKHFKLSKIWFYDVKSWPNKYMLERKYLCIMLCVYFDLRNSNIFHPLFILTSQTMFLGQIIFRVMNFLKGNYKIFKNHKKNTPKNLKIKGGNYHI